MDEHAHHKQHQRPAGSPGRSRWARAGVAAVALLAAAAVAAGCKPAAGGAAPAGGGVTSTTTAAAPSRPVGAPGPGAPPAGTSSSPTVTSAAPGAPTSTTSGTPATSTTAAAPVGPVYGCQLAITLSEPRDGERRTTIETLTFTNTGPTPCRLGGERPLRSTTAQFVGPDKDTTVGQSATGYGGDLQLTPGESTAATLTTRSTFGFDDDRCEPAKVGAVRLTPPADAAPVVLPAQLGEVCTGQALGTFLEVGGLSARG